MKQAWIVSKGLLLLAISTVVFRIVVVLTRFGQNELVVYFVTKGGFAIILIVLFNLGHQWRLYGFRSGFGFKYWRFLWPLWLGTMVSLSQGVAVTAPFQIAAWIIVAIAVALGEEGLFRGIILIALRPSGARKAIVVSSILFGLSHLISIFELDYRYVLGQAVFAAGLGMALAWVRLMSGTIWPCIIAHGALDAAGLLAANGVKDAFEYSVPGMIWIASFGAVSLAWGSYLVWTTPTLVEDPAQLLANVDQI